MPTRVCWRKRTRGLWSSEILNTIPWQVYAALSWPLARHWSKVPQGPLRDHSNPSVFGIAFNRDLETPDCCHPCNSGAPPPCEQLGLVGCSPASAIPTSPSPATGQGFRVLSFASKAVRSLTLRCHGLMLEQGCSYSIKRTPLPGC